QPSWRGCCRRWWSRRRGRSASSGRGGGYACWCSRCGGEGGGGGGGAGGGRAGGPPPTDRGWVRLGRFGALSGGRGRRQPVDAAVVAAVVAPAALPQIPVTTLFR